MMRASQGLVDTDVITAVAEKVAAGHCILFLGAGVHSPPPDDGPYSYPPSERPPTGGDFSEYLARKSDFSAEFPKESLRNLQRVALHYQRRYSRNKLVEEINANVDVHKTPSPALRALAQLNFPLVITTNYDHLFERALYTAGKEPKVGIYQVNDKELIQTVDYTDSTPQRPFVFKIHGDIDKPESIVITDEDYIQFVLRMSDKDIYHPIPETFRYNLKRWSTLFVGYSLLDYNLRLLFKTLRWKMDQANIPDTYSVDLYPDPLILEFWQNQRRFIKFIAQDVWTFVPRLYEQLIGKAIP